jgi:hypothetical protein
LDHLPHRDGPTPQINIAPLKRQAFRDIVEMIIGLVGAACIGTLVAMIVFGFLGKGFAVGWKIHADFSWEWFCGSLD